MFTKIKLLKKILLITIILMASLVLMPQMQNKVQAAVKISATKKTMYKGYTYKLKVTGTNKKIKWSSSDKSKATVNSKGKVYVKKNGKVTITAKVGGKKYSCKVTIKNKPYKLTQFSTIFYDLKDVAKKYKNIDDINNYGEYKYDLNGDGKKDTILLKRESVYYDEDYRESIFSFRINGNEIKKINPFTDFYVVDLDKSDKTMEIVFAYGLYAGDAMGPTYVIYQMRGNTIKKLGEYYAAEEMKVNQKGKMVARNHIDKAFSPYIVNEYYELSNGKINNIKTLVKNISKIDFKTTKDASDDSTVLFTTSKKNIGTENAKEIKKGTKFRILGSTFEKEVNTVRYVKLSNGTKGYMYTAHAR